MCRIKNLLQSRESRERLGQAETRKMAPKREQSCGLESRLQPLCSMDCTLGLAIREDAK